MRTDFFKKDFDFPILCIWILFKYFKNVLRGHTAIMLGHMGKPLVCVRARARAPAHVHVRQFFGVDVCGRARTCAACPHLHFFTIKSLKPIKFRKKNVKNMWLRVRVRSQKLVCGCVSCTLSKCVWCACWCSRKSAHTKGLRYGY